VKERLRSRLLSTKVDGPVNVKQTVIANEVAGAQNFEPLQKTKIATPLPAALRSRLRLTLAKTRAWTIFDNIQVASIEKIFRMSVHELNRLRSFFFSFFMG
jgi:hypothetical protein